MTCIVGVLSKGTIYIGGDTLGSTRYDQTHRKDDKVFRIGGDFLIGFTHSYRMGQVLRYAFEPPALPKKKDDLYKYMVVDFVDALRELFKDKGFATKESGADVGGNFMVGVRGHLFQVESDYQVAMSRDSYDACGSGASWALGSLYATPNMKPEQRIRLALKAAERFCPSVGSPFTVHKL